MIRLSLTRSDSSLLAQTVSAKLEEGNLKAAIRIMCSDDCPGKPWWSCMISTTCIWGLADLPGINPDTVLTVTEDEVHQAVLSFPAGSSSGPDRMWPQHLKDMLLCCESCTDFLTALTGFIRWFWPAKEWVSEQFLNGTSACNRLFSAMKLLYSSCKITK